MRKDGMGDHVDQREMEGVVSLPISRSRREADQRGPIQPHGHLDNLSLRDRTICIVLLSQLAAIHLIRFWFAGGYGQLRSPACPPADEIREEGSPPPGPPSGFLHIQRSPAYHHLKDGKFIYYIYHRTIFYSIIRFNNLTENICLYQSFFYVKTIESQRDIFVYPPRFKYLSFIQKNNNNN